MILSFGEFELDDRLCQLRRGSRVVRMEPRVFDLLVHLARHRDRVVSKAELMRHVWAGVSVSESSLSTTLNTLRRVLGVRRGRSGPIETVRGRGYRFVADVDARIDAGGPADADEATPAPDALFVGREPLRETLAGLAGEAAKGRGATVLFVGEPGVGKTCLAERAARDARTDGLRSVLVRCPEGDGEPAFWPFVQMAHELLADMDEDARLEAMGGAAPALGTLLPELVPEHSRRDDAGSHGSARFRFFDGMTRLLRGFAADVPLFLLIDDLHWADPASLDLLGYLAPHVAASPLLLVATLRDEGADDPDGLARTLAELVRHGRCERFDLEGFTENDTSRYLEQTTGRQPPRGLVSELHERTAGNPLFVREAVGLLARLGRLDDAELGAAWNVEMPRALREVIERRLSALAPPTRELLAVAAVLGPDFHLGLLAAAAGLDRTALLEALDEASGAGVIEPAGTHGGHRFSHALVRDVIGASLAPGERARLHLRVGEALLTQWGDDAEPVLAELAHHFHAAAVLGDGERALLYCERAARQAFARAAYEEAALHGRQALDALDLASPHDRERRLALTLALGEAQLRTADMAPTRATFEAAAGLAEALDDAPAFVSAALGYGASILWGNRPEALEHELLERALAMDPDPATRARLASRLAAVGAYRGPLGPPRETSGEAVALARAAGDGAALGEALHARHFVLQGPDHLEERDAIAREILGLAGTLDEQDATFAVREALAADCLTRGDRAGFDEALAAAGRAAAEGTHPAFLWLSRANRASVDLLEGRLAEAERESQEALELGRRVRNPQAFPLAIGQTLGLRRFQGRLAELEPAYEQIGASLDWIGFYPRVMLTVLRREVGRDDDARALAAEIASGLVESERGNDWLVSATELARVCAAVGPPESCNALHEALLPYAERHAVYPGPLLYAGPVSAALGALAAAGGQTEESRTRFEDALAACAHVGARPFRALIACEFGESLAANGEREGGRPHLETALAEARELALTAVEQRAARALGDARD